MRKVCALMVVLLAALAFVTAPAEAGFDLPPIGLDITYVRSLETGSAETCLTASFEVAKIESVPLEIDVLFAPDFETFGNWGVGASTCFLGESSRLKIGIGLMGKLDDPVVYLGFRLR